MKELIVILASAACLHAQGLDSATLLNPATDNWPAYYGDYSGRRFSTLSQINRTNVGSLTLAWTFKTHALAIPTGDADLDRSAVTLTSVPLEVNGVLYLTLPDHVWAVDAHTGRPVWHFYRPAPGNHTFNLGVGMYKDRLYFGTPDAHVVCLDARNGKKVWDVTLGDVKFGQAVTMAPIAIHDHVIVGLSGDGADVPGSAVALDPETGKLQWKWDAVPKPGDPGSETWPSTKAGKDQMAHGGGNPAMAPTYDPELNLLYFGTGSPRPAMAGGARPGANLYTCSIVALNADTGKMVWYFQASPHDTHNWDAVETPVLFDADFKGKPRKLLAQASRNGYFFVLDRVTGEDLVSVPFVSINWSAGVDAKGQPISKEDREPKPDGTLVSPSGYGAASWPPPSYSSDTKLFYVNTLSSNYAIFFMMSNSSLPKGRAGGDRVVGKGQAGLEAIDSRTGEVRWSSEAGGIGGVLTTAGGVVFTSGPANDLAALEAETGKVLWHARIGTMANSAITYELDDRQYIVTPVEGTVYAWTLPGP